MVKDHRGDTFVSEMEMCNSWGVDYRLFKERRRHGWNLRLALTTPFYEGTNIFDHKGNVFQSEYEMCEAYGIEHSTYIIRRKRGWSREEALTVEPYNPGQMQSLLREVEKYDPEDVLRALEDSKKRGLLRRRKEFGSPNSRGPVRPPVKDHKGHSFKNQNEMCKFWGIEYKVFHNRDMNYWPLCYALTYPKGGPYVFMDHVGNEFKSLAKMCNYYDIDRKVFRDRMNSGWALKDALTMAAETPIVEKDTLTS